ncbi:hypothetical protein DERF_006801 [Dermatophagoides farinae]|uniref:Uncharacterized protein n=1 Tax=Dermatophagoides farinae TaxID=6954 RepID=A0A922HZ55_DERFA|nr:hypothetical protein DERF_006801 [Dermatophagoides farinae]
MNYQSIYIFCSIIDLILLNTIILDDLQSLIIKMVKVTGSTLIRKPLYRCLPISISTLLLVKTLKMHPLGYPNSLASFYN